MRHMTTDLLFKNFHLLAGTPDGVKQLRQLILQLAVQGRLVPQNPDDPPASRLLQQIKAEKQRLIKEGKIKKQKPLPEIKPDEVPFELPKGWEWARLKYISFDLGQKKPDMEFTYIDVASIENNSGKVSRDLQVIQPQNAPSRARKIVLKNTVIFSTVRPYLLNIAVIEDDYSPEPIASTAFAILHPCSGISSKFLFYYLRSNVFIDYVNSKMTGIAYPAINDSNFFSGPIPIPPSPEQHRIVAKVDQLMALCDELEARQEKQKVVHARLNKSALHVLTKSRTRDELSFNWTRLKDNFSLVFTTPESIQELRSSILQLAVQGRLVPQNPDDEPASELLQQIKAGKQRLIKEGKIKKQKPLPEIRPDEVPYELPPGWVWTCFDEVGIVNPRNQLADELEVSFVPMASISDQYGVPVKYERGVWGKLKRGYTHLAENDIVLAKITPCFQNKKSAVMKGLLNNFGAGTTELHVIRPINNLLISDYALLFLKTPIYISEGIPKMTGSAGQKRVPRDYFARTPFPLPPLPEQHRIVAKVDQLMALCDELEASLTRSQADGQKLMQSVVVGMSGQNMMKDSMSMVNANNRLLES